MKVIEDFQQYKLYTSFQRHPSSLSLAQSTSQLPNASKKHVPMALIIEPARELAQQTHDNITRFKKHLPPPKLRYVTWSEHQNTSMSHDLM